MYDRQKERSRASCKPILLFHWSNMRGCVSPLQWAGKRKEKGRKEGRKEKKFFLYLAIHKCFHCKILCEGHAVRAKNWCTVQYSSNFTYWCRYYSESTRGDSIKCRTLTIVIVVKSVWGFDFCDWPLVGFQMLFFSFLLLLLCCA